MTVMVAWLWQGLVLVAMVEVILRASRRLNAATRHAVWWLALGGVLLLPLAHVAGGSPDVPAASPAPPSAAGQEITAGWTSTLAPVHLPAPPDWLIAVLVGGWAGSALLGIARIGAGLRAIRRLNAESRPMPAALRDTLRSWPACAGHRRRVELRVSDHHAGACALGLGAPVILVSAALAEVLEPEDLDAIVVHELAHLERWDDWTRLVQAVVQAIAGLHPAVGLIGRRLDLECEAACDDWVVTHAAPALRYATCLTELAARLGTPAAAAWPAVIAGALGSRGSLRFRVSRLLDARLDRGRRMSRAAVGAAALAAASVGSIALAQPRLIVVGHASTAGAGDVSPERAAAPLRPATAAGPERQGTVRVPPTRSIASASNVTEPLAASPLARRHVALVSFVHGNGSALPAGDGTATLAVRAIPSPLHGAPDARSGDVPTMIVADQPQEAPWSRAAAAGTALGEGAARGGTSLGRGAKRAGVSIGRFFGRTGKAVADSF